VSVTLVGIARHIPGFKPEILFAVHVGVGFADLAARWPNAPEAGEAASLQPIPVGNLDQLLRARRSELTPSGQASLYCAWRAGVTAQGFLRTPDRDSPSR
jgi:hypothetical protein